MDVEGGIGGPSFLDPIPEDVSVASNHAGLVSTASAVASSESGSAVGPFGNRGGAANGAGKTKKPRRGTRSWKTGEHSKSRGRSSVSTGDVMAAVAENISDANASLGGAFISERSPVERGGESLSTSPKCKKYFLMALGIVVVTSVGVFTIIFCEVRGNKTKGSSNAIDEGSGASTSPTMDLFPSNAGFTKTYSPDEVQKLDDAFLKVDGTSVENLNDKNTPEGRCRNWMIHTHNTMTLDNDYEWRAQQRYILCVMYHATNGDVWNKKNNWMDEERSECEWFGVVCDINGSVIEEIDLSDNNITGILPNEIGSLLNLRVLNVASNALQGTIPARLLGVTNELRELRACDNMMSGPLPTVWNTNELIELDLGRNLWTGSIPQGLWNLPSLKTLFLNHCNLTGSLPSSSENVKMHRLWLHSNSLSGSIPSNFGWNWTKLYSVKLRDNSLTGEITLEQCSQWEDSVPKNGSTEGSVLAPLSSVSINSMATKEWKLEVDCQIDCACCSNTNCAASGPDTDNSNGVHR